MAMTAVELAQALDISVHQVESALEMLKAKRLVNQAHSECDQCKGTGYVPVQGHAGGRCSCTVVGSPVKYNR